MHLLILTSDQLLIN